MTLTIEKSLFDKLAGWEILACKVFRDGAQVGKAEIMVPPEEKGDEVYLSSLDVFEEYRNQGIGTQIIQDLAEEYGFLYFAACDENSERLYRRIGEEFTYNYPAEVDQGYGVYYLAA